MIALENTSAIAHPAAIDTLALKAERVLIDEQRSHPIDKRLNLRCTGVLSVLVEAIAQVIAEVKPLWDALISLVGFWVAKPFCDGVLRFVEEGEGNE